MPVFQIQLRGVSGTHYIPKGTVRADTLKEARTKAIEKLGGVDPIRLMVKQASFQPPFILARREDIDPIIAHEWVLQALEWGHGPEATDQQKGLAQAILDQWGIV